MEGRAFSTPLLIDKMFLLPLQLFRPFSLENSQWHPVRFASWFICHISFISLNSLYLSSGPMHLSWAPQQCLQARSKHILHVMLLLLQLACFTLGVWSEWKINCLVSFNFFFSSHHQIFCSTVKRPHLTCCLFPLSFSFLLNSENCKRSISLTWKDCFVEDEWVTQLGEHGNDVLTLPTG